MRDGAQSAIPTAVPDTYDFIGQLPWILNKYHSPLEQLLALEDIFVQVEVRAYDAERSASVTEVERAFRDGEQDLDKVKALHIRKLREEYLKIVNANKDNESIKQQVIVSHLLKNCLEAKEPILAIYRADPIMVHRLNEKFDIPHQHNIQLVIANIQNEPKNTPVFLKTGSSYRKKLTQNYRLMRDMINESSPELRAQIETLKLINEVRWPWRRYSLRSLMRKADEKADEIEMKNPQKVIQKWVDEVKTNPTGFFARRRLARYQREAYKLSMDDKVDFLTANPGDANYFFGNKEFVKSLSQRPDLFFKMLRLPGSTLAYDLFKLPSVETTALARAVNASEDLQLLKAIKTILGSLALLSWDYHDLIEPTDLAIQSAQEKARRDKGKDDEVKPRVYELPSEDSVVKLNVNDFSILGNLLRHHQNAKQIMLFSEKQRVIININLNSEPADVALYVEENSKVKTHDILVIIQETFPEKIKITSDVSWQVTSKTFQEALVDSKIPHELSYQLSEPPSTFRPFAFIGQFFNYLFRPRSKDMIVIDSSSDSESETDTASVTTETNHARALSQLSKRKGGSSESMSEKSSDEMALEASFSEEEMPGYIRQYIAARDAFMAGNYKDSALFITALFNTLHAKSDPESGQDKFLPIVIGLLTKTNAGYHDVIMAEELLDVVSSSSSTACGQITTLIGALNSLKDSHLLSEPNYKKITDHLSEDSLTAFLAENPSAIQLYMLEKIFKSILPNKVAPRVYSAEQIEDINLLKRKYVQIANQCRDDGLAKKIIVKSTLLDFDPERKPTVERKAVTKLFLHDPVMTLELRVRTSRSLNIAMLKGISSQGKVDYFIAHPEHALFFLKDEKVQKEMAKPDYLTAMINAGSAELRQAIRQSGILKRKIKNKEDIIKLLDRFVKKEVQNILKDPGFAYAKLENDFLWEEISVRDDLLSQIQEKYPEICKERQYKNIDVGAGEAPTKHF